MRSVLGSLGPFQDISWHARQFLPVGVWAGPIISILLWWKIFDGRPSPNHYQSVKWSLRCILGHFKQNQRRCFFKKWPFVHSYFWLFLPHFCYLWPVLDLEHQKWTYSIPLDAKRTAKSQKMGSKAYLELWVLYIPKKPPRSENWP